MAAGGTRIMTGSFYGTSGADFNVRTVGFRPKTVLLINATSHDKLFWTDQMPDASGHKTVAAGTSTDITTLGITPLSDGFRLGQDTDMNVDDELVYYVAHE